MRVLHRFGVYTILVGGGCLLPVYADAMAQERFTVSPWIGRGFYPTTIQVTTLPDGAAVSADIESGAALGVNALIRLNKRLQTGVDILGASPSMFGKYRDQRERLGSEHVLSLSAVAAYDVLNGRPSVFMLGGFGLTLRELDESDTNSNLTGLLGIGVSYPLHEWVAGQVTARDYVSSYDSFTSSENGAPPTTVHEFYLTLGFLFSI